MIDVDEAYKVLFKHVQPGPDLEVPLAEALHTTLAKPVVCDVDYPPFDRSLMDGYAVRSSDVASVPASLKVVGGIPAGSSADRPVGFGEAMQINTGAPIPEGADAVVRVEDTELSESRKEVLIKQSVPRGSFITPQATYVCAGDTVLAPGTFLTPLEIGAAATAGAALVTVYRRPTVAILPTGDELIDIGEVPTGAQIRNSSQSMVEALVRSAYAEPILLGIGRDDPVALREKIEAGLKYDVLCIMGGVSMGEFDFVPDALMECGVTIHINKMAIKPGRPSIFGTAPGGTLVFALAGNPIGSFVTFELLVRPALDALQGRVGLKRECFRATLTGSLNPTRDRRSYWPARAHISEHGEWRAKPLSWHGSGDSFGMATANALIMQSPNADQAQTGDAVSVLLLNRQ